MLYAIVVILILIADQALKYWVTLSIPLDEGVRAFVPGVLELRNIHNNGVAFSLLSGASRWIFIVLALVVSAGIILAVRKKWVRSAFGRWMSILVIAGALGNALDRMLSGYVVDMLAFQFWPSFPVFNVADVCIVIGAIGFFLHVLLYKEPEEKAAAAKAKKQPAEGDVKEAKRPAKKPETAGTPIAEKQATQRIPVRPKAEPQPEAKPEPSKEDPFAAWDQAVQTVEQEAKARAAAAAAPEPIPEPKPSDVKPTVSRPKTTGESFSLDDILAEFKE